MIREVLLVTTLLSTSPAFATNWTIIDADLEHDTYYDKDSVRKVGKGLVTVNVKGHAYKITSDPFSYEADLYFNVEHDCFENMMFLRGLIIVDKDGSERSGLGEKLGWQPIPRGATAWKLHQVLCK